MQNCKANAVTYFETKPEYLSLLDSHLQQKREHNHIPFWKNLGDEYSIYWLA